MSPINKIAVPLDGSLLAEQAFPYTIELAKVLQAQVLLLRMKNATSRLQSFLEYKKVILIRPEETEENRSLLQILAKSHHSEQSYKDEVRLLVMLVHTYDSSLSATTKISAKSKESRQSQTIS